MKKLLTILALLINLCLYSQFAISSYDANKLNTFDKERFKEFKSTTTVFILSNKYTIDEYKKLLDEVWTVTQYIIVKPDEFDYSNYLDGSFSFCHLELNINLGRSSGFYADAYLNLYLLNSESINKKIEKTKGKQDKFIDLIFDSKKNIGRIGLYYNTDLIKLADKNNGSGGGFALKYKDPSINVYSLKTKDQKLSDYKKEMIDKVYNQDSFKNYSLGYLKNYFQQINKLISEETFVWLYEDSKTTEIKKLKDYTLYIPDYIKTEYRPGKVVDVEFSEDDMKKMLSPYKYKYEYISQESLDNKILNNEEFYYLRFVKTNAEFFIQVVNGKNGNVLYKDYAPLKYNMKDKDFKKIVEAINSK